MKNNFCGEDAEMRNYQVKAMFCAGIVMLLFVGCTTGEHVVSPAFHETNPDEVAVVDISGDIRGDAPRNQIDDFLTMELVEKGYVVIERERVNSILEEQDFQRSDRTTDEEAARIGEILNVPAAAMVDVNVDGEKVSLTGRMVDVETGEVLWIGSGRGSSGRSLATIFGAITGGLLGSQVGGGSGRTIATVSGGVLGGAAGDTLAPQTARVVQKSIKEMVKDLPAR